MRFGIVATWIALFISLFNTALFFLFNTRIHDQNYDDHISHVQRQKTKDKQAASLALLLSDFDEWAHSVPDTLSYSVQAVMPFIPVSQIIIASSKAPYPPISIPPGLSSLSTVAVTQPSIFREAPFIQDAATIQIKGNLVIVMPDALDMREASREYNIWLQEHMDFMEIHPNTCFLSFMNADSDFGSFVCKNACFDTLRWTLSIDWDRMPRPPRGTLSSCNYTDDHRVILLSDSATIHRLRWFQLPIVGRGLLLKGHELGCVIKQFIPSIPRLYDMSARVLNTPHLQEKWTRYRAQREENLYSILGIKLEVHVVEKQKFWHGCHKNSGRCFGTVVDDTPEYIHQGRWTPPCCLEHIRTTARYLFQVLNAAKVRYWLEGGTLLGAVRHGNIIEWDYDCDIGIYRDDIDKIKELTIAESKARMSHLNNIILGAYESPEGFVWEKAREGDFYRVQFSRFNHLHVDIFPFYEKDGVMTKDTWMETHRQDMEFPSSFLKPLETITFMNMQVLIPNHAQEFLEMKFGKGCIEHPRLPGPTN
eukprot:gene5338-8858_t